MWQDLRKNSLLRNFRSSPFFGAKSVSHNDLPSWDLQLFAWVDYNTAAPRSSLLIFPVANILSPVSNCHTSTNACIIQASRCPPRVTLCPCDHGALSEGSRFTDS